MKKTQKQIDIIKAYLQSQFGEIKPEWETIILLLGDNLDLYEQVRKELNKTGLFDATTYRKNPLISTLKDLQATILKQIQHLGLSPWSISKIKMTSEDDTDDFVNDLLN